MQVYSCIAVGLALYGITASAMPEGRHFSTGAAGPEYTHCTARTGGECGAEGKAPADLAQEVPASLNRGADGIGYATDNLMSAFESEFISVDDVESEVSRLEATLDFFTPEGLNFTFRYNDLSSGANAFEQPQLLAEAKAMKGVKFGSVEASQGGSGVMANLMFTSVPEPVSLILIILGLLGLKLSRRAFR